MFLFVPMFFVVLNFERHLKEKNSWVPTKKCICLILFDLCSVFCFLLIAIIPAYFAQFDIIHFLKLLLDIIGTYLLVFSCSASIMIPPN